MPDIETLLNAPAPDFALKTESGDLVRLSDFKNKQPVILFFYPGDMTPGCTMQLCAIRDDWQKFKDAHIAVFGVNHAEALSHQKFTKKHSLPFPLLIDAGKKVSAAYGALRTFFKVTIIKRSVIGIDAQGIVRYIKRGMPKNADILKAMQKHL